MPKTKAKPKKDVSNQYYTLSEDEIQSLITKAKTGDSRSQMELLKIFEPFLNKYVALLHYGKYKLSDYDVRQFINLFVPDKTVGFYLKRNKLNSIGAAKVQETVQGIRYMVERYGDEEDTRQTVNLAFLQCLMNYKRTESKAGGYVPFSGYIYSYFYFILSKHVKTFLIDQLGRKTFPLISDEDFGDSESDEKPQGFSAPPEPSVEDLLGPDVIDEFWVAGDTTIFPFDRLTIQERQLVKWRFVDGYKSSEIAQRITEHPNTVREHFNKIRFKLMEIMMEDDLNAR
jgi:hypothetical protein